MTTPTKIQVNCSTGEVEEIPLTAEEIAQREEDARQAKLQMEAEAEELARKEATKVAAMEKLKTLGLSDEEVTILLNR